MKRAILVISIVLIVITLGIIEVLSVRKTLDTMETSVINLYSKYEEVEDDITIFIDDVDNLKDYWQSQETWLCYLFNHRDLSTITDSLNRLSAYTENNDYDNAICELALLKEYSSESHHVMGFNIKNIL